MIIANRPLNYQALALEEAETEIRETVRKEYLNRTPKPRINLLIVKVIEHALQQIKIENLRKAARLSLVRFYNRQYAEISRLTPATLEILAVTGGVSSGQLKQNSDRVIALRVKGIFIENYSVTVPNANVYGVPLRKFQEDYLRDNVKPVFDRLIKDQPRDPNDESGRNTLRNLAEMEVRYNDHLQQIEDLKAAGHKLVIASTHADCSDRCRKWQGRVYSLDGTYGTTDDGRKYEPLENATDQTQTYWTNPRTGTQYKGGLLGYNCRHFLIPYKSGYRFPTPNAEEERKQYVITLKQREYERNVRHWRTEALATKGIDNKRYTEARKKAIVWNNAYIEYSRENKRAYYPSRIKIL